MKADVVFSASRTPQKYPRARATMDALFGPDAICKYGRRLWIAVALQAAVILLAMADVFMAGGLQAHGVAPRQAFGLFAILWSPLLSSGLLLTIVNAPAFMLMASLVLLRKKGLSAFIVVCVAETLGGGFFVWCFAPREITYVGDCSLTYALCGYLIVGGAIARRLVLVGAATIGGICHSTVFWMLEDLSVVPGESHVLGLVVGALLGCAFHQWLGEKAVVKPAPCLSPRPPSPEPHLSGEDSHFVSDDEVDEVV